MPPRMIHLPRKTGARFGGKPVVHQNAKSVAISPSNQADSPESVKQLLRNRLRLRQASPGTSFASPSPQVLQSPREPKRPAPAMRCPAKPDREHVEIRNSPAFPSRKPAGRAAQPLRLRIPGNRPQATARAGESMPE